MDVPGHALQAEELRLTHRVLGKLASAALIQADLS